MAHPSADGVELASTLEGGLDDASPGLSRAYPPSSESFSQFADSKGSPEEPWVDGCTQDRLARSASCRYRIAHNTKLATVAVDHCTPDGCREKPGMFVRGSCDSRLERPSPAGCFLLTQPALRGIARLFQSAQSRHARIRLVEDVGVCAPHETCDAGLVQVDPIELITARTMKYRLG